MQSVGVVDLIDVAPFNTVTNHVDGFDIRHRARRPLKVRDAMLRRVRRIQAGQRVPSSEHGKPNQWLAGSGHNREGRIKRSRGFIRDETHHPVAMLGRFFGGGQHVTNLVDVVGFEDPEQFGKAECRTRRQVIDPGRTHGAHAIGEPSFERYRSPATHRSISLRAIEIPGGMLGSWSRVYQLASTISDGSHTMSPDT